MLCNQISCYFLPHAQPANCSLLDTLLINHSNVFSISCADAVPNGINVENCQKSLTFLSDELRDKSLYRNMSNAKKKKENGVSETDSIKIIDHKINKQSLIHQANEKK